MKIREATKDDIPAIAKVTVDTWKTAYRGLIDPDYLDNLSYAKKEASWREFAFASSFVYVAEDDTGRVVGFAASGLEREGDPEHQGEIYAIYVEDQWQKFGVGNNLFSACRQRLAETGMNTLIVWVLTGSPYRRFYEKLGGVALETRVTELDGLYLEITSYSWLDNDDAIPQSN